MSTTTQQLIESVVAEWEGRVEEHRVLVDAAEAHGWTAADDSRKAQLDREISELRARAAELHEAEERSANLSKQREPFNAIIRGGSVKTTTELEQFLRHGGVPYMDVALETHDLTTGAASAGDFVPAGFVGAFYQHMIAEAAVRQTNVQVYSTSGGEPLKIPKSVADPTAAIVAEGVAITPNDPDFGNVVLGAYGYKMMVYVTRETTQDSSVDIEQILGRLLGRAIGTASGADYVSGNGTTAPQGVNTSPVAGVSSTWAILTAGATGPDLLTDLYFSVRPTYRSQGYWLMNDATLAALRKLKSTTNEYLVDRTLTTTPTESIFGQPVVTDPNVGTGAGVKDSILFGDFSSGFAIRDVGQVRIERSEDFRFANDEIAFRAVLRTDSKQVLNDGANAAVKALHQTA